MRVIVKIDNSTDLARIRHFLRKAGMRPSPRLKKGDMSGYNGALLIVSGGYATHNAYGCVRSRTCYDTIVQITSVQLVETLL